MNRSPTRRQVWPRARSPTTTTAAPSTLTSSPTATCVSEGTTHRKACVRARSIMDTGTAVSPSRVTQTVAASSVIALATDPSVRVSIRRINNEPLSPGIPEPTWSRRCAGKRTLRRVERSPWERISATSTSVGVACVNGWVQRHSWHRATPDNGPRFRAVRGSHRRIRCGVVRPQFSHGRLADWSRAAAGTVEVVSSAGVSFIGPGEAMPRV